MCAVLKTVLDDVVSRPESFSGDMLMRTRRRLGVSEVVAGGMHLDMYQTTIQVGTPAVFVLVLFLFFQPRCVIRGQCVVFSLLCCTAEVAL